MAKTFDWIGCGVALAVGDNDNCEDDDDEDDDVQYVGTGGDESCCWARRKISMRER